VEWELNAWFLLVLLLLDFGVTQIGHPQSPMVMCGDRSGWRYRRRSCHGLGAGWRRGNVKCMSRAIASGAFSTKCK